MSSTSWSSPAAELAVTPALVRALLEREHPDLAGLALGETYEG